MLALITRPEVVNKDLVQIEASVITSLFDQGLKLLHLRKPAASLDQLTRLVGCLKDTHRSRIVIHPPRILMAQSNVEMATGALFNWMRSCGLERFHLTDWLRKIDTFNASAFVHRVQRERFLLSTGIHDWSELNKLIAENSYCAFSHFLVSPVLDSVSKAGYKGKESLQQVPEQTPPVVQSKLFAMGGVGPTTLPRLKAGGFHGVALLGNVWSVLLADGKEQWRADTFSKFKICADIWKKLSVS